MGKMWAREDETAEVLSHDEALLRELRDIHLTEAIIACEEIGGFECAARIRRLKEHRR